MLLDLKTTIFWTKNQQRMNINNLDNIVTNKQFIVLFVNILQYINIICIFSGRARKKNV